MGQTVVKLKIHAILSSIKTPKVRINKGFFALLLFRKRKACSRSQMARATNYRSEILSPCSLGALRNALYFFLLCHCLVLPQAAAMPEQLHPEIFNYLINRLYILFYLGDKVNKKIFCEKCKYKILLTGVQCYDRYCCFSSSPTKRCMFFSVKCCLSKKGNRWYNTYKSGCKILCRLLYL